MFIAANSTADSALRRSEGLIAANVNLRRLRRMFRRLAGYKHVTPNGVKPLEIAQKIQVAERQHHYSTDEIPSGLIMMNEHSPVTALQNSVPRRTIFVLVLSGKVKLKLALFSPTRSAPACRRRE